MEIPSISIAGNVTVNLVQNGEAEAKEKKPSIPITPFIKATVIDVDNDLLWFNTHVNREAQKKEGELATELFDRIHALTQKLQEMTTGDYNTDLITVFTTEIAAASFLLYRHYGGEPILKNG